MEQEIYAKSDPRITLKQHIADGLRILECLKECFPKIPDLAGSDEFWEWIRLCVLLHDTGKAHAEFQNLLAKQPNRWNRQRHELFSLSFVFACLTDHKALEQISRVVAGHHKPMDSLLHHIRTEYEDPPSEFARQFQRVDIQGILEMLRDNFCMATPDEVQVVHPRTVVLKYCREIQSDSISEKHQLLLMTGAFKQCDHLSSAFVERIEPLPMDRFSFLDQKHAKLQSEGKDFFSHQKSAARQLGSAIITAPTGSGKTETALLWLRNQMQTYGHGRVFYVLPFTASINAMWQRLHHETDGFGEAHVGMLHGNLDAVLYERLFEETGDARLIGQKIKDVRSAFQSLETPIKVVTPFQLLKHIFGLKGFEKGIFEMSGGYFIFDEIHAYDPAVFAQIIVLLEYAMQKLGVRTLVMTATLPGFLKTELRHVAEFSEIVTDDELYERFKRHRLIVLSGGIYDGMDRIASDLKEGFRVLIVCNTVLQAQQMFDNLKEVVGDKVDDAILLHGAFNGEDRARLERRLKENPPSLLVGTQAIEVSLDIDYDAIYTELAPLDALLQRFGRVNRHRFWHDPPRPCYVFSERNDKDRFIYSNPEVIENTLIALKQISRKNDGIIDEKELQALIDLVYPGFSEKDKEKFEETKHYLKYTLSRLAPMEQSEQSEVDFYKQFDGEKVLPIELYARYVEMVQNFDFIGAQRLKVSIRKGEAARWLRTGILESRTFTIESPAGKAVNPIEIKVTVIKLPYSRELGLQKSAGPITETFFDERVL